MLSRDESRVHFSCLTGSGACGASFKDPLILLRDAAAYITINSSQEVMPYSVRDYPAFAALKLRKEPRTMGVIVPPRPVDANHPAATRPRLWKPRVPRNFSFSKNILPCRRLRQGRSGYPKSQSHTRGTTSDPIFGTSTRDKNLSGTIHTYSDYMVTSVTN